LRRVPGFVDLPPATFLAELQKSGSDAAVTVLRPGESTEL
jgi:hypothetical protein